jgi:hypothetical protein
VYLILLKIFKSFDCFLIFINGLFAIRMGKFLVQLIKFYAIDLILKGACNTGAPVTAAILFALMRRFREAFFDFIFNLVYFLTQETHIEARGVSISGIFGCNCVRLFITSLFSIRRTIPFDDYDVCVNCLQFILK